MSDGRRPLHAERLPWYLLFGTGIVVGLLTLASAGTYLSVADARLSTLDVAQVVRFEGTSPAGALLDSGTVNFTFRFTANNPSARDLAFDTVAYKVWIEDVPAEAHIPLSPARQDDIMTNGSRTQLFYLALIQSKQVAPYLVPSHGNATLVFPILLNLSTDPLAFRVVQNITDYVASTGGNPGTLAWNAWVLVSLDILGVPAASSPNTADYLLNVNRIVFVWGDDLGA